MKEINCVNAEDFWLKISEIKVRSADNFIFRGQGDAAWQLKPTIFLEKNIRSLSSIASKARPDWSINESTRTVATINALESIVIKFFVQYANQAGLPLPGLSMRRISDLNDIINCQVKLSNDADSSSSESFFDWIDVGFLEVVALARHNSLPTQLLDWSFSHLAAIYFAVNQAIPFTQEPSNTEQKHLAVYSLNRTSLAKLFGSNMQDIPNSQGPAINYTLSFPQVLRANNPFLSAQSGLFSYLKPRCLDEKINTIPSIEQYVDMLDPASDAVTKFTLSHSHIKSLQGILKRFGCISATMMPSYSGVIHSLLNEECI